MVQIHLFTARTPRFPGGIARMLWLSAVLCVAVLAGWSLTGAAGRGSGATAVPDHVTLTWTGDPATTMTVTWRTATSVTAGRVQYQAGATLTDAADSVNATASVFTTDLGPSRLFTTTLTGLTPNTPYTYRVGQGEHWSPARTFTTADPEARTVKFLVFGDSQSIAGGKTPYAQWRATVQNAFRRHPDARFLVNVGDLVDTGQSGAHWNAWFAAARGVIDTIPVMPVLGNHELYPLGAGRPTYWNAQFRLPQNGPDGLKNQVYSFGYGPVHFAMLDSQQGEQRRAGDLLTPQRRWLDANLAAARQPWKIAVFHKGPYVLMGGRDNAAIKNAFVPTLERHGADLVFSAHDHGVARTYPLKNGARVSRPSQGTVYVTTGRSGIKTYRNLKPQAVHAFFYNPLDQPNYHAVEVDDLVLTLRTYKADGTLVDTFVIDKASDCYAVKASHPVALAAAP